MAAFRSKVFCLSSQISRCFPIYCVSSCGNSSQKVSARCPSLILTCRRVSTFNFKRLNFKSNKSIWMVCMASIGGILYHTVYAAKPIFTDVEPVKRSQHFNFIADVVEKTAPAVVCIDVLDRHPVTGSSIPVGCGSGFIVRSDGLILTNAHVMGNKNTAVVKLQDGREFTGTIESIDVFTDLATLRISEKNLPTLKLGNSVNLRPGEWVVAMGSPLSLSNTITTGVVSSVHRDSYEIGLDNKNMEYIQTDAAITFGNSGGPLLNLDGEVIGINTMKVTAGISFAIPSNKVREFLEQSDNLVEKNKGLKQSVLRRRYMGITMLTLTRSIIRELKERHADFPPDVTNGVLIWKIIVGSPAYKGGLQPGDVVTKINEKPVNSATDIYKALESADEMRMFILRKQQKMVITIIPEVSG